MGLTCPLLGPMWDPVSYLMPCRLRRWAAAACGLGTALQHAVAGCAGVCRSGLEVCCTGRRCELCTHWSHWLD